MRLARVRELEQLQHDAGELLAIRVRWLSQAVLGRELARSMRELGATVRLEVGSGRRVELEATWARSSEATALALGDALGDACDAWLSDRGASPRFAGSIGVSHTISRRREARGSVAEEAARYYRDHGRGRPSRAMLESIARGEIASWTRAIQQHQAVVLALLDWYRERGTSWRQSWRGLAVRIVIGRRQQGL